MGPHGGAPWSLLWTPVPQSRGGDQGQQGQDHSAGNTRSWRNAAVCPCGSLVESHGEGQQAWALPSYFLGVFPSPAGAFGFSMLWPLGNCGCVQSIGEAVGCQNHKNYPPGPSLLCPPSCPRAM